MAYETFLMVIYVSQKRSDTVVEFSEPVLQTWKLWFLLLAYH